MTKLSRPKERAAGGQLQLSPTSRLLRPLPTLCAGPKGHCSPSGACVCLSVCVEGRTPNRTRHASLPAQALNSLSPAEWPQLTALGPHPTLAATPANRNANARSPRPSLASHPPGLELELHLGRGESPPPGPFGLGHQIPAWGWSSGGWSTWFCTACPSPHQRPAHRLCLLGEPLGEPLTGEPLGDPFPWVPLLSPLNMVVKAGAGSGWARRVAGGGRRVAACVLTGGLAGLWRGGATGHQEGRQLLGGPSLQARPGCCACTHSRPHSRPLLHNQFGRKEHSPEGGAPQTAGLPEKVWTCHTHRPKGSLQ